MSVELTVYPPTIDVGGAATWTWQTDTPYADAWWFGSNNGQPINVPVPGANGSGFWQDTYQYNVPAVYARMVMLYDDTGQLVDQSNPVDFQVLGVEQPPGGIIQPPEPPPVGGPPASIPPPLGVPSQFTGLPGELGDVLNRISSYIGEQIAQINTALQNVADAAVGRVGQALTDILPSAMEVLAGSNTALANFVANLTNQLTPTDDLWGSLLQQVAAGKGGIEDVSADIIAMLVSHVRGQITDSIPDRLTSHSIPPLIADLLKAFSVESIGPLDDALAFIGAPELGIAGPIGVLVIAVLLIWAFEQPLEEKVQQASRSIILPGLPTPDELAEAQRRDILSSDVATKYAHRLGIPDDVQEIRDRLRQELLSVGENVELWKRGGLDDETLDANLSRLGYEPPERDRIRTLSTYIPGPSDVVRFLNRDALIPSFVEEFGLDEDLDIVDQDKLNKLFGQLGIDHETMMYFWRAHWELPSIESGYRMFWRSLITQDQLTRLLRAHGVEPFWRDKQTAIAYHPFTRIDIRRLRIAGLVDQDRVAANYRASGYSPDDADLLAQYVETTVKAATDHNLDPWRTSLRTHYVSAFESGVIGESELTDGLTTLGYTSDEIAAFVQQASFVYTTKLYDIVRKGVHDKYVNDFVDEAGASTELGGYGVDSGQIERLIMAWSIEKQYREMSESQRAHRELSQSQIIEAYIDKIIDNGTAMQLLQTLHYSADDSTTMLALADAKAARSNQSTVRTTVQKLYVGGRIARADAIARLDAASINPANRDLLLDTWDLDRESKIQPLPLGTIEAMVRDEIMTEDQARTQLGEQGYTDTETTQLLALWGIQTAQALAKEQAAQDRASKTLAVADIKRAYLVGLIDQNDAIRRLQLLHYSQDDAALLVKLDQRDLATKEVVDAVRNEQITRDQAQARLLRIGYTAGDATIVLNTALGVVNA